MTATTAFLASLGILILFFVFKLFEHSKNFSAYNTLRKKGDAVVVAVVSQAHVKMQKIEQHLSVGNIMRVAVHHIASLVARIAGVVETRAQDVTRKISRNGNGKARETRSSYLEEVSTHKESLDTERVRRETSFTENNEA